MNLLPRAIPFWHCAVSWDTSPFRIVWVGFWMVSYDRSHRWFERWPHVSIHWNDDYPAHPAGNEEKLFMEPSQIVFKVTDGQETWIFIDIAAALEHIRQGVLDRADEGDEYHLEIAPMTEREIATLPVQ